MADIPIITAQKAIKAFEKHGFAFRRQTGSHYIMKKPNWPLLLSIPYHKGKTLPTGTLKSLIDS